MISMGIGSTMDEPKITQEELINRTVVPASQIKITGQAVRVWRSGARTSGASDRIDS